VPRYYSAESIPARFTMCGMSVHRNEAPGRYVCEGGRFTGPKVVLCATGPPYAPRMGDTWGVEGPPDEAYSRVTRDLAEVTGEFGRYLDVLPSRLTSLLVCKVRDWTVAEAERMAEGSLLFSEAYAVEPGDSAGATLLVGRGFGDGHWAKLAFGFGSEVGLPTCGCDACDEDSDDLIEEAEVFIRAATGGCREFRRRSPVRRWVTQGWETAGSSASASSRGASGRPFTRVWRPWPPA
jgi:hypothetical protein